MAVKWMEWEKNADRYDLQYRTAGDDHVREEHEALDGITLPMSDPFWNEYLPPMGWNCRCTAVRVRKGKYPTSDSDDAIQKGKNCTSKPKQQIFRFNPGKQEKIFPPKHPYFPKGCGDCEYKLSYDKNNPNCQACTEIAKCFMYFKHSKNEVYKDALDWGKKNIIGKYKYNNKIFDGRNAEFVKNSFTENLGKSDLIYAKIDVLNNIKSYLDNDLELIKETSVHGTGIFFYKTTVRYLGDIPEGKGRNVELQFKEYPDGVIVFHFIKFL